MVFADEPVSSLDPVAARSVMELLRDLNRDDGISMMITLHQVDHALRYCRRVVAMKDGRIAYDGPVNGLDRDTLVDIYGPEIEQALPEGAMT